MSETAWRDGPSETVWVAFGGREKLHVAESMEPDADGGKDVRTLCGLVYQSAQVTTITTNPLEGLVIQNCQTCAALASAIKNHGTLPPPPYRG